MTPEQLASLAQSLRDNEVFGMALAQIKADALDDLATVDPALTNRIIELQATVKVVDGFRSNLEHFIRAGKAKAKPGIA